MAGRAAAAWLQEEQRTAANCRIARRLGFWSALATSLLAVVYLGVLIAFFGTQGFVFPPPPVVQSVAGVVTFLTVPSLVVVVGAIREIPGRRGILGTLALCFTVLFAAMVSINRFVQLTVIRQAPAGPESADLARFLPYSTGSVMFALELLGWGFFMGLAALFAAPLFHGDPLGTWIRWVAVAFGVMSLLSVVGFITETPLTMAGFIAWGPLLLALAVLLTVFFRRDEKAAGSGQVVAGDQQRASPARPVLHDRPPPPRH